MRKIIIICILFLISCSVYQVQKPKSKTLIVLEFQDAKCKITKKIKTWFFLWGMVPLNRDIINSENLFPTDYTSYRINERYTTWDVVTNIFITFYSSFMIKTIEVETCRKNFKHFTPDKFNRLLNQKGKS